MNQPAPESEHDLRNRLEATEQDLRRLRFDLFSGALLRTYLSALHHARDMCRRWHVWSLGVLIIGAFAASAGAFVVVHTLTGSLAVKLTATLLGTLLGAAICAHLFYVPNTPALAAWLQQAEAKIQALAIKRHHLIRTQAEMRDKLRDAHSVQAAAERRRAEQRQSAEYRRLELFERNWRAMRGIEFEDFLREVFEALGFRVALTKTTGDQGVDLIVRRGPWRLAVQVKGYYNSVGNEAVQQAYAGMAHHNCQACAVITNSRFTASAKELAASTGCLLIDEDAMEAFVMGKMQLGPNSNRIPGVVAQRSAQTNA